jgi:hypothetical protein
MNALMTEAVRTFETSVSLNETTRHYIPESCHLHSTSYSGGRGFKSRPGTNCLKVFVDLLTTNA